MDHSTSPSHNHVQHNVQHPTADSNTYLNQESDPYGSLLSNGQSTAYNPQWHDNVDWLEISHPQAVPLSQQWPTNLQDRSAPGQGAVYTSEHESYQTPISHNSDQIHNAFYTSYGQSNYPPPQFDPALVPSSSSSSSALNLPISPFEPAHNTTIAPGVLENIHAAELTSAYNNQGLEFPAEHIVNSSRPSIGHAQSHVGLSQTNTEIQFPVFVLPPGKIIGDFSIISPEDVQSVTDASPVHNYLHIGNNALPLPIKKTTIPTYRPRRSRNEIKALIAADPNLAGRITTRPSKKASKGPVQKKQTKQQPATQLARAADKQESAASSSVSDGSDSEPSSEPGSDDELEITESPPLPASRPTMPEEAVRYDMIQAVWLPPSRHAEPAEIRAGLKQFWALLRPIGDEWKAMVAELKASTDEARKVELKEEIRKKQEIIEIALQAALQHGHRDIIELLGENLQFLITLRQLLAEGIRTSDLESTICIASLRLLSKCTTVTTDILERLSLSKVLTRFSKRNNETLRDSVEEILRNATAADAKKASAKKEQKPAVPKAQAEGAKATKTPSSELNAGAKRARPADGTETQAAKRVNSGSGPLAASNGAKGTGAPQRRASAASPEKAKNTESSAIAKPKANQVVTKPTGLFSSLQSASKKPGTSNAALAAAKQKNEPDNVATEKKSTAPATAAPQSFSVFHEMAKLGQKAEAPELPKQEAEKLPPETEEEKAKRLRKEARRKLRVTFKPEASLVTVHLFVHDPEEESRHDASMVRDVGDVGGEGRMFKRQKDMMDIDDEDEFSTEQSYQAWIEPSLIDFTDMDEEQREINYFPFGGGSKQPHSPDSEEQESRESTTLMAVYTHRSDIPTSPRETSNLITGEPGPVVNFGPLPYEVVRRLPTVPGLVDNAKNRPVPGGIRVYNRVSGQWGQEYYPTPPEPADYEGEFALLFKTALQFKQQNEAKAAAEQQAAQQRAAQQQALQQQALQQQALQQALQSMMQHGYQVPVMTQMQGQMQPQMQLPGQSMQMGHLQPPNAPAPNVEELLRTLNAHKSAQQQPQAAPPPPPIQPASTPGIEAILASLRQANSVTPQNSNFGFAAQQQQSHSSNFGFGAQQLPSQNVNLGSASQQAPSQAYYENPDRKRMRERQTDDWNNDPSKRQKWDSKPANFHPRMFSQPCRYYKEGRCTKGAQCTYRHD